jgi:hypothetical protein
MWWFRRENARSRRCRTAAATAALVLLNAVTLMLAGACSRAPSQYGEFNEQAQAQAPGTNAAPTPAAQTSPAASGSGQAGTSSAHAVPAGESNATDASDSNMPDSNASNAHANGTPGAQAVRIDPRSLTSQDSWGVCRLISVDEGGVGGSDLGFSIPSPVDVSANPDAEQLVVLFGDTWAQASDVCRFPPAKSDDLQATLPAQRSSTLTAGAPTSSASSACSDLHYTLDDPDNAASWRAIRLYSDAGERSDDKIIDMTFLRTPVTGFSDGAHTFVVLLRDEPAYCDSGADCPADARCSRGAADAQATQIGECESSIGRTDGASPLYCLLPSGCADGTPCVGIERGVCMAKAPFTLHAEGGATVAPAWFADDPRRAILRNMYIASSFWRDRPEDYAVGVRFATNKFVNAVARTVAHFDPEAPEHNDYSPGNHTLLLWGRPHFAAHGGAQVPLFLLYQSLEGLLDADGHIAWAPHYFAGYGRDGKVVWSKSEAEAQPVYGAALEMVDGEPQLSTKDPEFDVVNHGAMTWVQPLQRWVMFYGGSVPAWMLADQATGVVPDVVHEQPVPGAIHMRTAAHPWGRASLAAPVDDAWSAPQPVLTPDGAADFLKCEQPDELASTGCTVPRDPLELSASIVAWATQTAPNDWQAVSTVCMVGNTLFSYLYQLQGSDKSHLYGSNIIDSWTDDVTDRVAGLSSDERAVEIYWNVSTWMPYQVVLMKTQLRARVVTQ